MQDGVDGYGSANVHFMLQGHEIEKFRRGIDYLSRDQ